MHLVHTAFAIAILAALGTFASATAQQKQPSANPPPRPPVIINDPSIYRPPAMPPERQYYGPAPGIQPPMERILPPAPLAQPPIR